MASFLRLAAISITAKLALLCLQITADTYLKTYDESTSLLFAEESPLPLLSVTVRWDSHFFVSIAADGHAYEKNHAFFELYPRVLSFGTRAIQSIFPSADFLPTLLIFALLLNLALNVANTIMLYGITKMKFPAHGDRFCYIVSVLYQFTPSSAFYTAVYTESFFSFFILAYLYIFNSRMEAIPLADRGVNLFTKPSAYAFSLVPSFILSTAVFVRSNGMLWVAIVGFPILEAFTLNLFSLFTQQKQKKNRQGKDAFSFAVLFNTLMWGILHIIIAVIPFALELSKSASIYCKTANDDIYGSPASWCVGPFPNVYSYIQSQYWQVGFLTYYKLSKSFFIIWGVYTFTFIGYSLRKYAQSLWEKISGSNNEGERQKKITPALSIFQYDNLHAHMIYTSFLFIISVFLAHTQSSTRFFSSDPAFYWFAADILYREHESKSKIAAVLLIFYFVHFNVSGTFLFANFMTWT